MGNMILTSTVITDVGLSGHDTQFCKNMNDSKKINKGTKEQGNGKLLYVQTNRIH